MSLNRLWHGVWVGGAIVALTQYGAVTGDVGAHVPQVAPTNFELDGPGKNVDDPCFWVNPEERDQTLLFVTTKDSGLVEVFNATTGALVTSIPGFGRPNNCAVEGGLLLTTDRAPGLNGSKPGKVKIHALPDLTLVRTFGDDMGEALGIDVLTMPDGSARVYVTDSVDASVHVYDLATGDLVRSFPTGFGAGIEPILIDDRHGRVYVARGEKEKTRGIGLFDLEGKRVREFGAEFFSKDAEGMALYECGEGGYLLVAQQFRHKARFEVFDRLTLRHLGAFQLHDGKGDFTGATDGIDILQVPLSGFPNGMLAACDGCGSNLPDEMDVVSWDRVAAATGLRRCPGGVAP